MRDHRNKPAYSSCSWLPRGRTPVMETLEGGGYAACASWGKVAKRLQYGSPHLVGSYICTIVIAITSRCERCGFQENFFTPFFNKKSSPYVIIKAPYRQCPRAACYSRPITPRVAATATVTTTSSSPITSMASTFPPSRSSKLPWRFPDTETTPAG